MKILLNISRFINVIALLFLILGPYGIAITGFLQLIAALIFLIVFPKNILIYIYFAVVGLFFLLWNRELDTWLFIIPILLIFYLSYLIHWNKPINTLNTLKS
ncbi:hypothetical protein [Psychroserpens sp. SPM9]|uniref:hypothetical protein n=1 Tax=Psychroserpens sp. SPM9 TaxID=2975598 RepID=UPI0021A49DD7|nr:hypothetical protein [Psychroserpens sp. SPM9]MDG5492511.1 hypothetical protein [Psychroserpens sp. SPM9]